MVDLGAYGVLLDHFFAHWKYDLVAKSVPNVCSFRGDNHSLIAFYILFLFINQLTNELVQSCHLIKSTLTSFSDLIVILLASVQVLLLCSQYITVPSSSSGETIMLHSCDTVKTLWQMWWRKPGGSNKRGRASCAIGAPNDVSFKNSAHTSGISIHFFQTMQLYGQIGLVSIVDVSVILLFKVIGLIFRPGFEDDCCDAAVKS